MTQDAIVGYKPYRLKRLTLGIILVEYPELTPPGDKINSH